MVVGDWPGTLRIVAGVPDEIGPTVDSVAIRAKLYEPHGVAADDEGMLYLADRNAARILSVSSSGRLTVLAQRESCYTPGACLDRPHGIALDGSGALIIADARAHSVWRLDPSTRGLERLAGTGARGGAPDGTPARQAALAAPTGVAVDADGRIYVAETDSNRVRVIEPDGRLSTLAGTGAAGSGGDAGPASSALLNGPMGLAISGRVLYIADRRNHRVRAVDLDTRIIRTVAGRGVAGFDGDDGAATESLLREPMALAVTGDGRLLFIADSENARVRVVDMGTGTIRTFAGNGDRRYTGNGGSAGATGLDGPSGLAVFRRDLLFIADAGHHLVWRGPVP